MNRRRGGTNVGTDGMDPGEKHTGLPTIRQSEKIYLYLWAMAGLA
jgi:hypothetical protein